MSDEPFLRFLKSHKTAIICIILTLAAIVVRLIGLGLDSLWFDEVLSVHTARLSLSEIINFTSGDVHPPLYYLLLHFWTRVFGQSESAVRLLSVCFSVLTVLVIYLLAIELFDRRTAFFAALLTAISPLHVVYAQETRMYAQLAFLATTSVYFFVSWLKHDTRIASALYVISTALLLYTHIYGMFIAIAEFLFFALLLVWRREAVRKRLRPWLTMQFIIGLLFLPWAIILLRQATKAKSGFWIRAPDWLAPFQTLIEYCGSLWLTLLLLPLFVYGIRRCCEQTNEDKTDSLPHLRALLLLWLIVPIGVPFLLSKLVTPFYLTKYTIAASLPFYLLAAFGLAQVRGVAWQAILALLLCAGFGTQLTSDLTTLKRERWRDAAYNLERVAQAGDLVLFNSTGSYMSFAYYARRKDMDTAVFPYSATDEQAPNELTLSQRAAAEAFGSSHPPETGQETRDKLQNIIGGRRRVWIVTRYGEGFKDDFMNAFGKMFRVTTQPALCVSQRRFLFTETYSATDSAIFLQKRELTCAAQVYLLER